MLQIGWLIWIEMEWPMEWHQKKPLNSRRFFLKVSKSIYIVTAFLLFSFAHQLFKWFFGILFLTKFLMICPSFGGALFQSGHWSSARSWVISKNHDQRRTSLFCFFRVAMDFLDYQQHFHVFFLRHLPLAIVPGEETTSWESKGTPPMDEKG